MGAAPRLLAKSSLTQFVVTVARSPSLLVIDSYGYKNSNEKSQL
jgi:hypothetical protein